MSGTTRRTVIATLGGGVLASCTARSVPAPGKERAMITIRPSGERGGGNHGWLETKHSFSFADYHDPAHMQFRALRVINEDHIKAARGFPTHPHRDMEIITYVLAGALEHKDSMGNGSLIRPGEVQRMTAGTGVTHSEFATAERNVHLLQIWLLPSQRGLTPGYEQKSFGEAERRGKLRLVASPDGAEGSVTVHQDVRLHAGFFAAGERASYTLAPGRHAWVQVARGSVELNGHKLEAGDGAAASDEGALDISGIDDAELLVFDLG